MDSAIHGPLDEEDLFDVEQRKRVLPPLKRVVYKEAQNANGKVKQAGQSRHAARGSRSKKSNRSGR